MQDLLKGLKFTVLNSIKDLEDDYDFEGENLDDEVDDFYDKKENMILKSPYYKNNPLNEDELDEDKLNEYVNNICFNYFEKEDLIYFVMLNFFGKKELGANRAYKLMSKVLSNFFDDGTIYYSYINIDDKLEEYLFNDFLFNINNEKMENKRKKFINKINAIIE